MSDTKQKIIVKYHIPTPQDSALALYTHTLGEISEQESLEICHTIKNMTPNTKSCICGIIARQTETQTWNNDFTSPLHELLITHIFWRDDKHPLCCVRKQHKKQIGLIKMCARNLMAGKCHDEFMRNTLGKALFPAHYNNQK